MTIIIYMISTQEMSFNMNKTDLDKKYIPPVAKNN